MAAFGQSAPMDVTSMGQFIPLDLELPDFDFPELDPNALLGSTSSLQVGDLATLLALFPDERGSPMADPLHARAASDASAAQTVGRSGNSLTDSSDACGQLPGSWQHATAMQQDMPPPSSDAWVTASHSSGAPDAYAFASSLTAEAVWGSITTQRVEQQQQQQQQQQAPQLSRSPMVFTSLPQPQRAQHVVTTAAGGAPPTSNCQQFPAPWAHGAQQQRQAGMAQASNGGLGGAFAATSPFDGAMPQGGPSQLQAGGQLGQQDMQLTPADLFALSQGGSVPVHSSGSMRNTSASDGSGELRAGGGFGASISGGMGPGLSGPIGAGINGSMAGAVGAGGDIGARGAGAAAGPPVKEEPAGPPPSRFKRGRLQAKQRMQDMEREVEEKLRVFKLLSSENEDLKTKSQMLEKVILVRERQISLLKTHGPATEDGDDGVEAQMAFVRRTLPLEAEVHQVSSGESATGAAATGTATTALPSTTQTTASASGASAEEICCDADTSSPAPNFRHEESMQLPITQEWAEKAVPWNSVLAGKCAHGTSPAEAKAIFDKYAKTGEFLTVKDHPMGDGTKTFERKVADSAKIIKNLKVMPLEDVVTAWKCFVTKCTELLMDMNNHPDDPEAQQRLVMCVNRMGFATMNVAVLNPDVMMRFSLYNMEEQRVDNAWEDQDHWRHVLEMVELTDQQERQLLQVLSLVGRDLVKNVQLRRRLQAEWRSMMSKHEVPRPGGSGLGKNSCEETIKQAELVKRATASFRREYNAVLLLNATMFDQILTSEQIAKMAVYSYPYFPHVACIAVSLAEQRGISTFSKAELPPPWCGDMQDAGATAAAAMVAAAAKVQAARG